MVYFILGMLVMAALMIAYQRSPERWQHQGSHIGAGGTPIAMQIRSERST
jgi:hypothetical protein